MSDDEKGRRAARRPGGGDGAGAGGNAGAPRLLASHDEAPKLEICARCAEVTRLKNESYQARKEFRKVRDRIWRRLWKLVAEMPA